MSFFAKKNSLFVLNAKLCKNASTAKRTNKQNILITVIKYKYTHNDAPTVMLYNVIL